MVKLDSKNIKKGENKMIYRNWIKEEKENFEKEKTKLFIEGIKREMERGLCTFSGQCDEHNCKGCSFHKD